MIGGIVHDRELARALGRVLAHEIGHVLLGAPYHDQTGLMRAVFLPDELAGSERSPFRLTPSALARLRSRHRVPVDDPPKEQVARLTTPGQHIVF